MLESVWFGSEIYFLSAKKGWCLYVKETDNDDCNKKQSFARAFDISITFYISHHTLELFVSLFEIYRLCSKLYIEIGRVL